MNKLSLTFLVDGQRVSAGYAVRMSGHGQNVPCIFKKWNNFGATRLPSSLHTDGETVWLKGNSNVKVTILKEPVRANINAKKLEEKRSAGVMKALPFLMRAFGKKIKIVNVVNATGEI